MIRPVMTDGEETGTKEDRRAEDGKNIDENIEVIGGYDTEGK